jgi:hypothetical protein
MISLAYWINELTQPCLVFLQVCSHFDLVVQSCRVNSRPKESESCECWPLSTLLQSTDA